MKKFILIMMCLWAIIDANNHGKTKSERFQKRKAIFHSKNEM